MKQLLIVCLSLIVATSAWNQAIPIEGYGPLGGRGNAFFSFELGEGQFIWTDAVVHPEGFFTLTGTVLSKGVHYLALARFLPNGTPDCSFQNEGLSELRIPVDWEYMVRIARTSAGRLLVLFNPPKSESALFLARFYEDGFLDTTFGEEGILRVPVPKPTHFLDMLLQEDDAILVAGFEENPETNTHTCRVIRLLSDGQIDPEFDPQPPPPSPHAFHLMSLASLPDGRIMLAALKDGKLIVGRLLPNGRQDLTFGEEACKYYPISGFRPYDLLQFPDSSWMVLGSGQASQKGWPIAVKGLPDGQLDTLFGDRGVLYAKEALEVAASGLVQPDGKWLFAGMGKVYGQTSYFIIRRFLEDGTPDQDFGAKGYVVPCFEEEYFQGSGIFLKAMPDGHLLTGGTVNFKGALASLDESGHLVKPFGKDGMAISVWGGSNPLNVECCKILTREDGSIIATGTVEKPFESEILSIRLESDGALDPTFSDRGYTSIHLPNSIVGIDAVLQQDGKLIVGGRMRALQTQHHDLDFAACRLNPDGSLDTTFANHGLITFDRGPFDVLGALALQKDGKILLAGDMENPETLDRELVVYRLLPNGQPDTTFGIEGLCALRHFPSGTFSALMLQEDGKILLLDAHPPWGFDIVRLLSNGKFDRSFAIDGLFNGSFPDANTPLQSLLGIVTASNQILVMGQMGNQAGFIRLEQHGELDISFGENGLVQFTLPETAWEMTLLPTGQILLAGSGCADFAPYFYFFGARFSEEGQPDSGFGDNGVVFTELAGFSYLSSLLVLDDQTAILGGKGYTSESDTHTGILLVRYLSMLNAGHLCPAHEFPFMDVYPYPISPGVFSLDYDLPARSNIIVSLFTPEGKKVETLLDICRPEGAHSEWLEMPANLPSGSYLLQVQTEEVKTVIRIIFSNAIR
ncbi:MAG: hypothetical protein IPL49_13390 [Saprospirales bacterium]|nr:hypothetical protein [Saprospirales bacterium]